MKKQNTTGYLGEKYFYKVCQKLNIPVIWKDRTPQMKMLIDRGRIRWEAYQGLKWDFELGYTKIEVKTSNNWMFQYSHNFPHFDYLVVVHMGLKKRIFIIPRWELPCATGFNAKTESMKKWLFTWENRFDLLS